MARHWLESNKAYTSLCQQGAYTTDTSPQWYTALDDVTYYHPRKGHVAVVVDNRAIAGIARLYAQRSLHGALRSCGASVEPWDEAIHTVRHYLSGSGKVWGLSGFATSGFGYQTEADGIYQLYSFLASIGQTPVLAVDGGGGAGALGLHGIIAKYCGASTLGVSPLQGLQTMAPRDHMIIKGDRYIDREELVGVLPDILVCVGGGDGTVRECRTALSYGSTVLLLNLKDYGPSSFLSLYQNVAWFAKAKKAGQLHICTATEDISQVVLTVLERVTPPRNARLRRLAQLLDD